MGPNLLHVDTRQLKKFERDLRNVKASAIPYAARATINTLAFESQRTWRADLPGKMKLRSKYTQSSVQVQKATSLNISTQAATVGSTASYMATQELGDSQTKKGKHGVPIPAAAPGKRKTRGRVAKGKQLRAIKLGTTQGKPLGGIGRGIRKQALVRLAAKGGGFAFINLGKSQGIFHVKMGAKRLLVKKVWDLTKQSVRIPRNPSMQPSVKKVSSLRDGIWREALIFQLRRHRAFGY